MQSAFGVEHPEPVSKLAPQSLKAMLQPYKGAVPKAKGAAQLAPSARPKTMALRNARRNAGAPRLPKPGEAMR